MHDYSFVAHDLVYLSDEIAGLTDQYPGGSATVHREVWAAFTPTAKRRWPQVDYSKVYSAAFEAARIAGMSLDPLEVARSNNLKALGEPGSRHTIAATFERVGWRNYRFEGWDVHSLELEVRMRYPSPTTLSMSMGSDNMPGYVHDATGRGRWVSPFVGLVLRTELKLPLVAYVETLSVSGQTVIVEPLAAWLWLGGLR